jgi:hypothetical protein
VPPSSSPIPSPRPGLAECTIPPFAFCVRHSGRTFAVLRRRGVATVPHGCNAAGAAARAPAGGVAPGRHGVVRGGRRRARRGADVRRRQAGGHVVSVCARAQPDGARCSRTHARAPARAMQAHACARACTHAHRHQQSQESIHTRPRRVRTPARSCEPAKHAPTPPRLCATPTGAPARTHAHTRAARSRDRPSALHATQPTCLLRSHDRRHWAAAAQGSSEATGDGFVRCDSAADALRCALRSPAMANRHSPPMEAGRRRRPMR